ncbi:MAG: nucleotide exchange factor GrpE [bacterium]|nr:nucleotide exchange factor GrpE [bacterium]
MEEELLSEERESLPVEDIESIKQQYKELEDKFLRLAADFDNYRKRMVREIEELKDVIRVELIKGLLPILDDIERAFFSIPEGSDSNVKEGLGMVMKNFQSWLFNQGVRTIEIVDNLFDPRYHEAIIVEESKDIEEDRVEELRKGYLLNDRIIRPAMVKIIKKVKEGE